MTDIDRVSEPWSAGPRPFAAKWSFLLNTSYGTFRGWVRHTLASLAYCLGFGQRHTQLTGSTPTQRLVFVCWGNINRSAFAAQLARDIGLNAVSIGLSTASGARATPQAIAQARVCGVSLADHRATELTQYSMQAGDLLIVMEARHVKHLVAAGVARESIILLGAWARPVRLHLHDPHTLSPEYFASCFSLIESAVRELGRQLRQPATQDAATGSADICRST